MKVLVIGAGAVGLSAALVAEHAGHQVTLVDPRGFDHPMPKGEIDAKVWALGPSSRSLLSNLGVSFDSERICPYQHMRVIDSGSDARVEFISDQLGNLVESNWLCARLADKVISSSIVCRMDPINAVSSKGEINDPIAQLEACDLAVFCEGRAGRTAEASGFEKRDLGFHQYAVIGTLGCTIPHMGEAFQIFTPEGPLALLPLPDDGISHRVSLVWSVPRMEYCRLSKLRDTDLLKTIEYASESARGRLIGRSKFVWTTFSQHDLKYDNIGVCLALGDTAHGILPLAGLGANLGFADVRALADTLIDHKYDGQRITRTVARLRRLNNLAVIQLMATLSASFQSRQSIVRLARSFAFRTANRHRNLRQIIQELAS